jgi:hypothetical protein
VEVAKSADFIGLISKELAVTNPFNILDVSLYPYFDVSGISDLW